MSFILWGDFRISQPFQNGSHGSSSMLLLVCPLPAFLGWKLCYIMERAKLWKQGCFKIIIIYELRAWVSYLFTHTVRLFDLRNKDQSGQASCPGFNCLGYKEVRRDLHIIDINFFFLSPPLPLLEAYLSWFWLTLPLNQLSSCALFPSPNLQRIKGTILG